MIVLENEKLIILTPTGVEAEAIHRAVCSKRGALWVLGTNANQWVDEHTSRIPDRWLSYDRALVVRNPFTRALALFEEYNRHREKVINSKPYTFAEFIGNLARLDWHYSETIADWVSFHDPVSVIHYETLSKDLKALGVSCRLKMPEIENWRQQWYKIGAELIIYFRAFAVQDVFKYGYAEKVISEIEARARASKYD